MKYLVLILLVLLCQLSIAQNPTGKKLLINGNLHGGLGVQRVLIDFGGNGSGDLSLTDDASMTPDNTARRGQDGSGKWWNNVTNGEPSVTLLGQAVDINNVVVGNLNISLDKWPRGTFSTTDSSMNFNSGSTVGAVSDYVATATQDNLYFHSTAGDVTMTITIPAGRTATIKFWGSRITTGITRTLQVKKGTDGSYTQGFNALNNSTYTQAATLTGITGTATLNFRVQPGQTFGHLSVMDITLEDL